MDTMQVVLLLTSIRALLVLVIFLLLYILFVAVSIRAKMDGRGQ